MKPSTIRAQSGTRFCSRRSVKVGRLSPQLQTRSKTTRTCPSGYISDSSLPCLTIVRLTDARALWHLSKTNTVQLIVDSSQRADGKCFFSIRAGDLPSSRIYPAALVTALASPFDMLAAAKSIVKVWSEAAPPCNLSRLRGFAIFGVVHAPLRSSGTVESARQSRRRWSTVGQPGLALCPAPKLMSYISPCYLQGRLRARGVLRNGANLNLATCSPSDAEISSTKTMQVSPSGAKVAELTVAIRQIGVF